MSYAWASGSKLQGCIGLTALDLQMPSSRPKATLVLPYGPQELPTAWSHIPILAVVSENHIPEVLPDMYIKMILAAMQAPTRTHQTKTEVDQGTLFRLLACFLFRMFMFLPGR